VSQNVLPAVFGVDGQPCAGCGAPLAGDQRYCLYCGSRRAEARLEFMDALVVPAAGGGGPTGPPPGAGQQLTVGGVSDPPSSDRGLGAWLRANTAVLALAGLLMGMLFIGLLVGHWATSGTTTPAPAQAAAPQVIRVEGSGTAAAADDAAVDSADDSAADAKKDTKKAKAAKEQEVVEEVPKDAVDVNKINNLSGKAKAKAIDDAVKKGKPISTGTGKLPPKDNKAAGGGTEFETIG